MAKTWHLIQRFLKLHIKVCLSLEYILNKQKLNLNKKIIGIGETGLDFHYSESTQKHQIFSLIKHIEVAKEHNLPVIIHARDADAKIEEILTNEYKKGAFNCVMHCFSSSSYLADAMIELGF